MHASSAETVFQTLLTGFQLILIIKWTRRLRE